MLRCSSCCTVRSREVRLSRTGMVEVGPLEAWQLSEVRPVELTMVKEMKLIIKTMQVMVLPFPVNSLMDLV